MGGINTQVDVEVSEEKVERWNGELMRQAKSWKGDVPARRCVSTNRILFYSLVDNEPRPCLSPIYIGVSATALSRV